MEIRAGVASILELYRALVGVVTPRPIAWVTTLDVGGRVNLAPYSFFNVFGANPPLVVFSSTLRRDGTAKDTLRNVERSREFVLNAAVEPLAEAVNLTAVELPHGQSEADLAGLTLVPSTLVRPPRIAESPVHLECRLIEVRCYGEGAMATNLVIGEVVLIAIDDAVLDAQGNVDPRKLQTIGRLGGDWYCRTGDVFALARPAAPPPPSGPGAGTGRG